MRLELVTDFSTEATKYLRSFCQAGAAASYAVSVRQASVMPRTSFRFHLAMGTLVSG